MTRSGTTRRENDKRSAAGREPWILDFEAVGIEDVARVGGKTASLGEMIGALGRKGVRVPGGFAVTAAAYRAFVAQGGLEVEIRTLLDGLDTGDLADLRARGRHLRDAILAAEIPESLADEIGAAYDRLGRRVAVAVRSSATAEDLPEASFAGQQETLLNVRGHEALLDACRQCFASLFTDRAISYRVDQGLGDLEVALSIGVQRMVRSDLACSGVMFSIDPESGFQDAVVISAAWGLGENVVQGAVNPDEYTVFKPTLRLGKRPIVQKTLGSKALALVYSEDEDATTVNRPVERARRDRFCLDDEEILALARWACTIEEHYSEKHGRPTPMDLEWAKDGETQELFIVQARPETVVSKRPLDVLERYRLQAEGRPLVTGSAVGQRIGVGPVRMIETPEQIETFRAGEVLVTDKTDPDWEPIMKQASAIVTNRGGRTCHAAIVSRELGVPAIVGTEHATTRLEDGQTVTVSCAAGALGAVYDGALPFTVDTTDLSGLVRPRTEVMLNLADPSQAFRLSFLPNDGVGLAREEFVIANVIRVHPLALLDVDELEDPELRAEIARATVPYQDMPAFFVDKLAEGIGMIGAAFYPRPVIVRLSDFKSNEYAHLIGGFAYEPAEENPMLGFRGASRYYDVRYRRAFALECRALRKARDEMGLENIKIMVPFCRTVEEGRRVIAELATHGLHQGENGLEVYVMCEVPSNVILAEQFAEVFDGFSIGSNDLTQLTLGVDRDSEIIAHLFDERDEAVKALIAEAIRGAHAKGRKIGICGQAPSDDPELAQFLVEQGIDSISLSPDAVLDTTLAILEIERALEAAD